VKYIFRKTIGRTTTTAEKVTSILGLPKRANIHKIMEQEATMAAEVIRRTEIDALGTDSGHHNVFKSRPTKSVTSSLDSLDDIGAAILSDDEGASRNQGKRLLPFAQLTKVLILSHRLK
jgi:hypothetical protein